MFERKEVNIEKYIKSYEKREIKVADIAKIENISTSTINKRINEYYKKVGRKRPYIEKPKKKTIDIEKYIKAYEAREVTLQEISEKEKLSVTTINKRISEYYEREGKVRPILKERNIPINIQKYIKEYEEGEITVADIADKEQVSVATINKRINNYYIQEGKKRLSTLWKTNMSGDIDEYIKAYEEGNMTIVQIATKEGTSETTIRNKIKKYYEQKGKNTPKIGVSTSALKDLLNKGITKEQIIKEASKRNIIIPDSYFEKVQKEIEDDKTKGETEK